MNPTNDSSNRLLIHFPTFHFPYFIFHPGTAPRDLPSFLRPLSPCHSLQVTQVICSSTFWSPTHLPCSFFFLTLFCLRPVSRFFYLSPFTSLSVLGVCVFISMYGVCVHVCMYANAHVYKQACMWRSEFSRLSFLIIHPLL